MTKLNQTGRREAKKLIESHFSSMIETDRPINETVEEIRFDQTKKFKKELLKIKKLTEQRDSLLSELQEKIPQGLKAIPSGELVVLHTRKFTLTRAQRREIEVRNKPILKEEKKAMATLQTIETLEELKELFESVGI